MRDGSRYSRTGDLRSVKLTRPVDGLLGHGLDRYFDFIHQYDCDRDDDHGFDFGHGFGFGH